MRLGFKVLVALFATSCALVQCSGEEHLVPKHGLESKINRRKRDLSVEDTEMILKSLLAKLKHGEDTELLHEKISSDKDHYAYGSEIMDKAHLASMKEEEMKFLGKSEPLEHEYMKDKLIPMEKDGYEVKKDVSLDEGDMMALMKKMKEVMASKDMEEMYKKEASYESPDEKFLLEKTHLSEESALKQMPGKMFEGEMNPFKASDKDVSLAESLYHMKIAGDVETYPEYKMESLIEMYNKKMADEKLHLEDIHDLHKEIGEESFLKKVDDVGKSLLKEESYPLIKEGNAEEYLKKVAAEEKGIFHDAKSGYLGMEISLEKSAEEKALDAWKASHKDLFAAEEGHLLDEKVKLEGAHQTEEAIAHGISDELMKKLKTSLGMDKELTAEHDELFHMTKDLHKGEGILEGSFAYEKAKEQAHKDAHVHLSEEEMKKHIEESLAFGDKDAAKAHGTELFFEKGFAGEKAHGIDAKMGVDVEKSLHKSFGEEVLKSKEAHGLDKAFDFDKEKAFYGSKAAFGDEVKHSIAHEIPFAIENDKAFKGHEDELLKKGFSFKSHEDELLKKDMAFKGHEDEFFKKDKTMGTDMIFHDGKELLGAAGDHHTHVFKAEEEAHVFHDPAIEKHHVVGAEKDHTILHDLKAKFFELLTRVLRTRKCHLVTMRPAELLGVINCISKSKNPELCEKFAMCEKKMPFRVITAREKCQRQTIPGEVKKCTSYAPLFPSPDIPLKIFQCVALSVGELHAEEKKHVMEFEECAKALKAESCGRFKWFRGPH